MITNKTTNSLEISERELEMAGKNADKTIDKVFGNKFVQIMVFTVPSKFGTAAELADIKRKMTELKGLNSKEIEIATKVGLISKDQAWFSRLGWQQMMKESETNIKKGRYTEGDINDLLTDLQKSV